MKLWFNHSHILPLALWSFLRLQKAWHLHKMEEKWNHHRCEASKILFHLLLKNWLVTELVRIHYAFIITFAAGTILFCWGASTWIIFDERYYNIIKLFFYELIPFFQHQNNEKTSVIIALNCKHYGMLVCHSNRMQINNI